MHLNEFSGALVSAGSHNAYILDKVEQQQQQQQQQQKTLKVKSSYHMCQENTFFPSNFHPCGLSTTFQTIAVEKDNVTSIEISSIPENCRVKP
jgi:hypothetical protein